MSFNGLVLTTKGMLLQSKVQTGAQLNYTKVDVGDGTLASGQSLESLNALINKKMTLPITGVAVLGDGNSRVRTVITNTGLAAGFYVREYGLFATDPDVGEILYAVGNAGNECDYLPAGGGSRVVENQIDLVTAIGNATNVTAVINGSAVTATLQDLMDHNGNPDAHSLAMRYWQRQRAYAVGEVIRTRTHGSPKYMECTVGGTTAATEPTWPAAGQTVVDGNVTWRVCDFRQATAQFDNSGRLATTAWVKQASGQLSGSVAYKVNATLTAANAGQLVYAYDNNPVTFTLPPLSTMSVGSAITIANLSSAVTTINCAAGDALTIDGSGNVTTITIQRGETLFLTTSPGATLWIASGTGALAKSASFGSLMTVNGYQKLPNGLIIQWGSTPVGSTSADVVANFPITFPNKLLNVSVTAGYTAGSGAVSYNSVYFTTANVGGFVFRQGGVSGQGAWYIAIGY